MSEYGKGAAMALLGTAIGFVGAAIWLHAVIRCVGETP